MSLVRILEHGQVTIPKVFREALGIQKGDLAEAELEGKRIVITPKKLLEDRALKELKAVLAEVHQKNKGVTEEEVVKYAMQAITELRQEEYAKQKT